MRPVGCRSDDLLGGPIRVSRSRLKFKVSRPARTPGICETGPGGGREGPPRVRCDVSGCARVSTHEQNLDLQENATAGRKQDPPTRPAGTKAKRRVPGARPERWARSRRARSVCGSHDPSHHPKEGRSHDPRKRYDAIVLGSGQVSYLLLIGCFSCLVCFTGLDSPPSLGGCGGWGGLGGTGGCGLGGGFGGWGGRAG